MGKTVVPERSIQRHCVQYYGMKSSTLSSKKIELCNVMLNYLYGNTGIFYRGRHFTRRLALAWQLGRGEAKLASE